MYSRPTCSKIYKTTQSFDPEGILGSLNSILLTYLGCRAGRLLTIDCKNKVIYAMKWLIYSFLCLFAFYLVTNFDLKNGLIPVNKNIWTLSYTLITASSSFLLQAMLYYIIDVKQLWTGNPFCYLGSNSNKLFKEKRISQSNEFLILNVYICLYRYSNLYLPLFVQQDTAESMASQPYSFRSSFNASLGCNILDFNLNLFAFKKFFFQLINTKSTALFEMCLLFIQK